MTEEDENIFQKALDALSSKDEEEALAEALKQLEELKKALEQANSEAARAKAAAALQSAQAKAQALKAVQEAEKRAAEAEAKVKQLEAMINRMRMLEEQRAAALERQKRMEELREAAKPKIIAEHTLTSEETLSHLALKYYGHATKPYWMVIYEANKELIGDNPNRVRKGMVIKIPELPPDFKP